MDEASGSFQRFCGVPSRHFPGTQVDPPDDARGRCDVAPSETLVFLNVAAITGRREFMDSQTESCYAATGDRRHFQAASPSIFS
jgi:hypothetical protein